MTNDTKPKKNQTEITEAAEKNKAAEAVEGTVAAQTSETAQASEEAQTSEAVQASEEAQTSEAVQASEATPIPEAAKPVKKTEKTKTPDDAKVPKKAQHEKSEKEPAAATKKPTKRTVCLLIVAVVAVIAIIGGVLYFLRKNAVPDFGEALKNTMNAAAQQNVVFATANDIRRSGGSINTTLSLSGGTLSLDQSLQATYLHNAAENKSSFSGTWKNEATDLLSLDVRTDSQALALTSNYLSGDFVGISRNDLTAQLDASLLNPENNAAPFIDNDIYQKLRGLLGRLETEAATEKAASKREESDFDILLDGAMRVFTPVIRDMNPELKRQRTDNGKEVIVALTLDCADLTALAAGAEMEYNENAALRTALIHLGISKKDAAAYLKKMKHWAADDTARIIHCSYTVLDDYLDKLSFSMSGRSGTALTAALTIVNPTAPTELKLQIKSGDTDCTVVRTVTDNDGVYQAIWSATHNQTAYGFTWKYGKQDNTIQLEFTSENTSADAAETGNLKLSASGTLTKTDTGDITLTLPGISETCTPYYQSLQMPLTITLHPDANASAEAIPKDYMDLTKLSKKDLTALGASIASKGMLHGIDLTDSLNELKEFGWIPTKESYESGENNDIQSMYDDFSFGNYGELPADVDWA